MKNEDEAMTPEEHQAKVAEELQAVADHEERMRESMETPGSLGPDLDALVREGEKEAARIQNRPPRTGPIPAPHYPTSPPPEVKRGRKSIGDVVGVLTDGTIGVLGFFYGLLLVLLVATGILGSAAKFALWAWEGVTFPW